MLPTYSAVLRGDTLEWTAGAPDLPAGAAVAVHVTVLAEPTPARKRTDGPAAAAALQALADAGGALSFGDPLEWQREERKDRPLPGRDE